mgnify:CR=1 FL=1
MSAEDKIRSALVALRMGGYVVMEKRDEEDRKEEPGQWIERRR